MKINNLALNTDECQKVFSDLHTPVTAGMDKLNWFKSLGSMDQSLQHFRINVRHPGLTQPGSHDFAGDSMVETDEWYPLELTFFAELFQIAGDICVKFGIAQRCFMYKIEQLLPALVAQTRHEVVADVVAGVDIRMV